MNPSATSSDLPLECCRYRCRDLTTPFRHDIRRILVTGASGYIGGRLVPDLICRGYKVRIMVRGNPAPYRHLWPTAEIIRGDALEPESLTQALAQTDAAYYLIHSMVLGPRGFAEVDIQAARNFRRAAEKAGVKHIIYLGGLGETQNQRLSSHLCSRSRVAAELSSGPVTTTVLRASIIIGSGSASFEIIKSLVQRLPIIPLPTWAFNKSQPIGIRDVIKYLVGILEADEAHGQTLDIGGANILTYAEMLRELADVLGRKVHFLRCGPGSTRFYGYIMSLITPVPAPITLCLADGLKNETVCTNSTIGDIVPFQPLSYRSALERALCREEQDLISTRWSDAYPAAHELSVMFHELRRPPRHVAHYSLLTTCPADYLFSTLTKVGGREGWFEANWMWRVRGLIDRLLFGVGTARGRRSQTELNILDVIDFWRVEDLIPARRLLLRAEMRMPGRAWLEFTIIPLEGINQLTITAHYATRSLWGDLYWNFFRPFHWYIFAGLLKQIEKRACGENPA